MSRAFVKESEDAAGDLELPERAVSAHRNLVTPSGLAQIEGHLKRLDGEVAAARAAADKPVLARCQRDLRYWQQRRASAELVVPGRTDGRVRFGSTVTIELGDGSHRSFRLVGEDEADPAAGTIAYVAPIAAAMIGAELGESVQTGAGGGEIIDIG